MTTTLHARVTRIIMFVNAVLAGSAAIGIFFGLVPHSNEHPYLVRIPAIVNASIAAS